MNLKDGGTTVISLKDQKWWHHPKGLKTTDVAVTPFELNLDTIDQNYISFIHRPDHVDRIPRLGEEVFIMGLFRSHYGKN